MFTKRCWVDLFVPAAWIFFAIFDADDFLLLAGGRGNTNDPQGEGTLFKADMGGVTGGVANGFGGGEISLHA